MLTISWAWSGSLRAAEPPADAPSEPAVLPIDRSYRGAGLPEAVPDDEVPAAEPEPLPELETEIEVEIEAPPEPPRFVVPSPLEPDLNAPRPRHALVYDNLLAGRYNPLGLVNELSLGYRHALASHRVSFGALLHAFVTPALARVGPRFDLQPIVVLTRTEPAGGRHRRDPVLVFDLSAGYDFQAYFGVLRQLLSFSSPVVDASDETRWRLGRAGAERVTYGHLVTLRLGLTARRGPWFARDDVRFYYQANALPTGDRVFYDPVIDIVAPNRGWTVTNDLDLGYTLDLGRGRGLEVAGRYTLTHAFYGARHYLFGQPYLQPNGPTMRVGPALFYTFFNRPDRRFNRPTLALLAQWWVRHRYRTGADVSAGVPYVVLAFLFEGVLWPDPRRRAGAR